MIPSYYFLGFSALLLCLSVAGLIINRKNLLIMLMCLELILLAVNTNLIVFSRMNHHHHGEIFVFFILAVAASEAAIGLAMLVALFRKRRTINVEALEGLKS